jgi:glucose-6-phosphate isomerase
MESTGKSVNLQGETVNYNTGPIIWGTDGNSGQHAYYQLLHQGTAFVPIDFILARQSHYAVDHQQMLLYANCLSQAQALMQGRSLAQAQAQLKTEGLDEQQAAVLAPHLVMPGNHPSNILLMEKITPFHLCSLLALYEHKTYVQSCLWNINCFDQWGVELGKEIARDIAKTLADPRCAADYDSSTQGLIALYQEGLPA